MKKTILLIGALTFFLLLYGTSNSHAVSAKKAKKIISKVDTYITQVEIKGYAAPKAKRILRKSCQAYEAGDYKKARKLAEQAATQAKIEVAKGPRPVAEVQIAPGVDLSKYKRVAVLDIDDAFGAPGSGDAVAAMIVTELLARKYDVIDRRSLGIGPAWRSPVAVKEDLVEDLPPWAAEVADRVLEETGLKEKIIEDLKTTHGKKKVPDATQIGKISGVDAIITGTLSKYGVKTHYQDVPTPYGTFVRRRPYTTIEMSIKMVDAKTGSTIWQGNGSYNVLATRKQPAARAVVKAILDELSKEKTQ